MAHLSLILSVFRKILWFESLLSYPSFIEETMAAIQPPQKPKPKNQKSISASAIFKQEKAKTHPSKREHTIRAQRIHKKPTKVTKSHSRKRESKSTPKHPLAIAFSGKVSYSETTRTQSLLTRASQQDSIERSRTVNSTEANALLNTADRDLSSRIRTTNAHSSTQLASLLSIQSSLHVPIDEEKLAFKSHDGKSAGTVILGDRMQKFRQVVAVEEKEIEMLGQQWEAVQKEIRALALQVLDQKGLEELLKGGVEGELGNWVSREQKERAEAIEKERKRFEEEIGRLSEKSVSKMRAGEKVSTSRIFEPLDRFTEIFP